MIPCNVDQLTSYIFRSDSAKFLEMSGNRGNAVTSPLDSRLEVNERSRFFHGSSFLFPASAGGQWPVNAVRTSGCLSRLKSNVCHVHRPRRLVIGARASGNYTWKSQCYAGRFRYGLRNRVCVCVCVPGYVRTTECNVTRFRASVNRIQTSVCLVTHSPLQKGYCVGNYHLDLGHQWDTESYMYAYTYIYIYT